MSIFTLKLTKDTLLIHLLNSFWIQIKNFVDKNGLLCEKHMQKQLEINELDDFHKHL